MQFLHNSSLQHFSSKPLPPYKHTHNGLLVITPLNWLIYFFKALNRPLKTFYTTPATRFSENHCEGHSGTHLAQIVRV